MFEVEEGGKSRPTVQNDKWLCNTFVPSQHQLLLLPSVPDLPDADIKPLCTHEALPSLISLALLLSNPLRRVTLDRRPLGQPLRTRIRYRARHGMPRPSNLTVHVHTIATSDPNGYSSLFRIFAFCQLGFSSCNHEYAIATKGEGSESPFAQLADVAMDWHVVFLSV
jgi:hypothetical protein